MTHLETAKFNSLIDGYKTITKYLAELYSINEYGPLNSDFMVAFKELNTLVDKQNAASKKIKNNSTKARTELVETILKYAVRAKVTATKANNYQLYNALNIDNHHFSSCTKLECMHRAIEVRNVLKYNMSKLPNINNEVIREIDDALEKYDGFVEGLNKKLKLDINKTKKELNDLLDKCSFYYYQICDLATSYYSKTKPTMISELAQAKIVVNRPGTETTLSFKILDKLTEVPIVDACIIDDNTGKIFKTTQAGIIEIPAPRAGTFQFKIVDTIARNNQVFLAVVKQGRVNDFTIKI
jgi:hypothetical protein